MKAEKFAEPGHIEDALRLREPRVAPAASLPSGKRG